MNLEDRIESYKVFFVAHEAGKELLGQTRDLIDRNLRAAMDINSLDHLSRAKGNQEVLDLIENVLKMEVKDKK